MFRLVIEDEYVSQGRLTRRRNNSACPRVSDMSRDQLQMHSLFVWLVADADLF
jgi:hypothetical protein